MRTTSLILALVMQSVITVSLAQDAKTSVGRPIPEEHKNFVAEVESVFRKFPKASARYKLRDFGENPVWACHGTVRTRVVSSIADRFVNLNVRVGKEHSGASSPAPPVGVGETSNPNRCAACGSHLLRIGALTRRFASVRPAL